jgi:signal transduction histidine kinase
MSQAPDPSKRIFGAGEMADRIRAFDWSATPVGPIDQWPDTLLVTVNMLLASRQAIIFWWGTELTQFYNDAYRQTVDAQRDATALGQRAQDCWPEIWPLIGPQMEAVMTRGESTWFEDQYIPVLRNGIMVDSYWTYSYSPVRNAQGIIRGVIAVCADTTSQHNANIALQNERARLLNVISQAPVFFALLEGPNHKFAVANPLYRDLVANRDILGKTVAEALPEVVEQGYVDVLDNVFNTGKSFAQQGALVHLVRTSGQPPQPRYLDFTYQPLREPDGDITGIIVLGIDVTESKLAEKALLQSEKLAAVGRLASTIAHEINNPMESVTNLLYLARNESSLPTIQQYLELAELELRRMSAITVQTLAFNKQLTCPTSVTCVDLLTAVLAIYESRLTNSGIAIERRKRANRSVLCMDGEIRQVLNNLVANAIDAMPHGGRLILRTHDATRWATGAQGLTLTIADTGTGISPENRQRVFEPFFTTKGLGGTGLGLWLSGDIVRRHHGYLNVRSSTSHGRSGTVFTLFLPLDGISNQPKAAV